MSEKPSAWTATKQLHETFFDSSELTYKQLALRGVWAVVGSSSSRTVRRLEILGEVNGREARQVLSRDRFDNFHLSTTFLEEGGEHIQTGIRPESPPEAFDAVEKSLFMQALADLTADRQQS